MSSNLTQKQENKYLIKCPIEEPLFDENQIVDLNGQIEIKHVENSSKNITNKLKK